MLHLHVTTAEVRLFCYDEASVHCTCLHFGHVDFQLIHVHLVTGNFDAAAIFPRKLGHYAAMQWQHFLENFNALWKF